MFSIYKPVILMVSIMGTLLIACHNYDKGESNKTADITMAETQNNAPTDAGNKMEYGVADSTAPVPAADNEEQPSEDGKRNLLSEGNEA
jgi:hypothetical protein